MGYVRVVLGENQLGLEADCAWAKPGTWTELNVPCYEDGGNCLQPHLYILIPDTDIWHVTTHYDHPNTFLLIQGFSKNVP